MPSPILMFAFFSPTNCQPYKILVVTFLHDSVLPLEGLTRVSSRLVTYYHSLMRSRVLLSLSRLSNLLQRYTRVAFGLSLGGCMDIPATVAFVHVFLSFTHVNASKSTIIIDSCLLTCLALSIYGRSFSIDLHRTAGP